MKYIDVKYLRLLSPQLALFTDKGNDLFNFRCPICGDSERDRTRARGYVFPAENRLIFKCHNCGDSRGMGNLLKSVDPRLADEYRMEMFEAKFGHQQKKKETVEKLVTPAPLFQANSPSKVLLALEGVKRISDLPEDHKACQYMRGRKIDNLNGLFYCADDKVLEKLSTAYIGRVRGGADRILIPFTDRTGNLVGLTGRALDPDALRYLHIKITEDPLIYGLDNWEPTEYTYVVEGQFDAMFLPNALAVGGSDLAKLTEIVDKHNTVFVFDNEPRNRENTKKLRKLVAEGYAVCVWSNTIGQKDINDMVIAGVDVKREIDLNTVRGLSAELAINDWSR